MANSEARLKAIAKYNRANTRTYCLRLNKKTDKDLIEFLDSLQDSKQGFIKRLIRKSTTFNNWYYDVQNMCKYILIQYLVVI